MIQLSIAVCFAKSWGGGGIYMANLFAYRATDPQMMSQEDPIGPENDAYLQQLAKNLINLLLVGKCWNI
jgi:hypothetical protein